MNANTDQALLDKLRKLKAKAEDSSVTEAEAALYAAKVSELLSAHNLSEAVLEVQTKPEFEEGQYENSQAVNPWAQSLASMVAELYFCTLYMHTWRGKSKTVLVFVGRAHNVEVAKSMTDYLIKTINRLASAYAKSPDAMIAEDYSFTVARNGFQRGCANRLYWRINELYKKQNAEPAITDVKGNPSNLPALYKNEQQLIADFLKPMNMKASVSRGTTKFNSHSAHGRRAAENISLQGQVCGGSTQQIGSK